MKNSITVAEAEDAASVLMLDITAKLADIDFNQLIDVAERIGIREENSESLEFLKTYVDVIDRRTSFTITPKSYGIQRA